VDTNTPAHDVDLDLRSLRYFVAVAEELNFTRAAARLFVAQQAISRNVRRLEERLGTQLFVRSTRRVALTAEGHRVLDRARDLIALHDQLLQAVGGPQLPIVIDLLSEGRLTGPRMLEAARTGARDREFRGRYGSGFGATLDLLREGQVTFALGRADWNARPATPWLERSLVRYEPLAVLLPAGHPLAELEVVPVAALADMEIDVNLVSVEAPEWSDLARQFLQLGGARATPPHLPAIGLENQADHLVRQGLPILTGVDHVDVPGGVVRAIVDPVPIYAWSLVWRRGADRRVVDVVLEAARTAGADRGWLDLPDDAWLPLPERNELAATRRG
jgi:DNA-binding transcriptional LysR family regulator